MLSKAVYSKARGAKSQRSDKKPKKGKAWQDKYELPHLSCTSCQMWRKKWEEA